MNPAGIRICIVRATTERTGSVGIFWQKMTSYCIGSHTQTDTYCNRLWWWSYFPLWASACCCMCRLLSHLSPHQTPLWVKRKACYKLSLIIITAAKWVQLVVTQELHTHSVCPECCKQPHLVYLDLKNNEGKNKRLTVVKKITANLTGIIKYHAGRQQ